MSRNIDSIIIRITANTVEKFQTENATRIYYVDLKLQGLKVWMSGVELPQNVCLLLIYIS